ILQSHFFLAACIQTWYYCMHQTDRWPLRILVAVVMLADTLHQALIAIQVFFLRHFTTWIWVSYTKTAFTKAEVLVNGITAVLVQSFLTYRVWQLSKKNIWITTPAVTNLAVFDVLVCVTKITILLCSLARVKTFVELANDLTDLSITVNVLAAVGDTYIAGMLTLLLHTSRTGFRRTDSMINKLVMFAVNIGALTRCAFVNLDQILSAPIYTFIYISFFFCMGRLYANSLLATLNIRTILRKDRSSNIQTSGAFLFNPESASNRTCYPQQLPSPAISVKIDTTTEFTTDQDPEKKHSVE
ncbi:hypothetical protein BT96DRAFT_827468, partial [Gymnopus androsaceus JB14]